MKRIYTTIILMMLFIGSNFSGITANTFNYYEQGLALYYADYLNGRTTASGEVFSQNEMTCAHKTLPFGTILRVTRTDNNMSVLVRVNDRGPFCDDCSVDLSRLAAEQIDLIKPGKKNVHIEVVGFSNTNPKKLRSWAALSASTSTPIKTVKKSPKAHNTFTAKKAKKAKGTSKLDGVRLFPYWKKGFVVQLGAYSVEENAHRQILTLQKKGVENLYLEQGKTSENKNINRVYIGPFDSRKAANTYLKAECPKYGVTGVVTWAM